MDPVTIANLQRAKPIVDKLRSRLSEQTAIKEITVDDVRLCIIFTLSYGDSYELPLDDFLALYADT
jgi:hypothetical protein